MIFNPHHHDIDGQIGDRVAYDATIYWVGKWANGRDSISSTWYYIAFYDLAQLGHKAW